MIAALKSVVVKYAPTSKYISTCAVVLTLMLTLPGRAQPIKTGLLLAFKTRVNCGPS